VADFVDLLAPMARKSAPANVSGMRKKMSESLPRYASRMEQNMGKVTLTYFTLFTTFLKYSNDALPPEQTSPTFLPCNSSRIL
jgi:hypothetical protein